MCGHLPETLLFHAFWFWQDCRLAGSHVIEFIITAALVGASQSGCTLLLFFLVAAGKADCLHSHSLAVELTALRTESSHKVQMLAIFYMEIVVLYCHLTLFPGPRCEAKCPLQISHFVFMILCHSGVRESHDCSEPLCNPQCRQTIGLCSIQLPV